MAAFSALENPNLVWQRLQKYIANANPIVQNAFRDLKVYLSQQKLNANLQIVPFTAVQAVVATGTLLGTGTNKVYAVYGKKESVATACWLKLGDSDTDAATGTSWFAALKFTGASDENFYINPNPTALTTGAAVICTTGATGTTASTGATTAVDGFLLIG